MNVIEKYPGCIAKALNIIGDKWTCLILRELLEGNTRFTILQMKLQGISSRTLSKRLISLEKEKIVQRDCFASPLKIEYSLTRKGLDLIPLIKQMAQWGEKYS